ncbi:hypothetical protein NW754_011546 [Fusarium falciforme]|nr:hypothetical protein NW754_011546 [Fusarium falciforme]KAJ4251704.1 hypothetical protein NW757_006539 [Fusarium falciforme]
MAPGSSPSASSIRSKTTRRLLERLLKLGYGPNKVYGNVTFWARFLWDYAGNAYSRFPAPMLHTVLEAGILETLLRHGADPTTYVSSIANGYKIPFWLHLVLVGPHIEWYHQLAFEKVWILTLERTPALSQAEVLKKVDSQSPWVERESWTTHCLWDVPLSEILVEGFRGQPQPENRFFLGLLENVLDRVRDSPATFERYQTWFAQYICVDTHELMQRLPSGLQEMSFRKRLAGEDDEGGSRTTKARRLV